jgi:glycosyltransferase involved in cell wall biosynthesis
MKRFVAIAVGIGPPGTMGGNTKILLEVVRNFPESVECLVITSKPETFAANGVLPREGLRIVSVPALGKPETYHPFASAWHYTKWMRPVFLENKLGTGDVVFCVSDFFCDFIPAFIFQKRLGFAWLPSFFLFVPTVFENLRKRYGFPVFRYIAAYLQQRFTRRLALMRCAGAVVTNEMDAAQFPARLRERVFAAYGGVNVEQISGAVEGGVRYDVVFCGRLHQQKGIEGLLDIWRLVIDVLPDARLGVIGNGDPAFERRLHEKAVRLRLDRNIEWLGYVNHEAKYRVYKRSSVFVHPTVYDNNGMVAAEALCSALPVVMYDLPLLRHVYQEGCVKVPERDRRGFAACIVRLLSDPDFYQSVRPTESQIGQLRDRWRWENRARLFIDFVSGLA